ncbi:hypothetical protein C8R43DRAFT_1132392 [Mycena crocata]|nr:hypothetical protein C8R43DRAFT_1132392 [Mycena crocata]
MDPTQAAEFQYLWNQMLSGVAGACTTLVLYAPYVILFWFSIFTLRRRNPVGQQVLFATASLMFFLGTCGALIDLLRSAVLTRMTQLFIQQGYSSIPDTFRHLSKLFQALTLAQNIFVATNNVRSPVCMVIASAFFPLSEGYFPELYRCYVIWGSCKIVLVLSMLTCLVAALIFTLKYASIIQQPDIDIKVPYGMAAITIIGLVSLSAGRIWYVKRSALVVRGGHLRQTYDTALAMILESGALYLVCGLPHIIALNIMDKSSAFMVVFSECSFVLLTHAVNIVPTLILVRVGLNACTWDSADKAIVLPK